MQSKAMVGVRMKEHDAPTEIDEIGFQYTDDTNDTATDAESTEDPAFFAETGAAESFDSNSSANDLLLTVGASSGLLPSGIAAPLEAGGSADDITAGSSDHVFNSGDTAAMVKENDPIKPTSSSSSGQGSADSANKHQSSTILPISLMEANEGIMSSLFNMNLSDYAALSELDIVKATEVTYKYVKQHHDKLKLALLSSETRVNSYIERLRVLRSLGDEELDSMSNCIKEEMRRFERMSMLMEISANILKNLVKRVREIRKKRESSELFREKNDYEGVCSCQGKSN